MLDGTKSGCINHPGIEAVIRCKQCGKPVCGSCVVQGATGRFCSETCKEKHLAFAQHAQKLEGKARGGTFRKVRKAAGGVIVVLAVLFALGVIATVAVDIPVITDIAWQVRNLTGI
jgi:hypothetical protein